MIDTHKMMDESVQLRRQRSSAGGPHMTAKPGTALWTAIWAAAIAACACGQSWESVPALPTASQGRVHPFGVAYAGRVYAVGGTPWVNGNDGSVHSLIPGAAAWQTEISLDGGSVIGQGGGVDALGEIVIFGGKILSNGDPGETVSYDPVDGPSGGLPRRPDLAPDRYFAWCVDGEGRIYSIGGGKGREAVAEEGNVGFGWRYVAASNSWEVIASMTSPVGDAAAVYDGHGHILVIGGVVAAGGSRSTNVARYDLASGTWSDTAIADLPTGINGHRAVVGANGWVYVIGGEGGALLEPTMLDTVWIFRPDLNAWLPGPSMSQPRRYHGAVLGPDNYIYVFGGENNSAALESAERLYTPPCPTVTTQPDNVQAWVGANVGLSVTVAGGTPLSYRWQKDGAPLSDGPLGGGSTVSGTLTASLTIENVSAEAEGLYSVVATNSCGFTQSVPATVMMLVPPNIDGPWVVTNLHPGWAEQSYATDVDGARQVGYGVRDIPGHYNNIDLACEWSGTQESCTTFAGPASVGGAFYGRGGGHRVGYWWWPYQCYYSGQWHTCYSSQAALWDDAGNFANLQVSGWEYSHAVDTDGVQVVGSMSTDDAVGNVWGSGVLWTRNTFGNWSYVQLMSPFGFPGRDSNASAVFGGKQYGSWQYRGVNYDGSHACMWSGTANSLVGMEPPGSSSSGISAAHVGQQGGSAGWGQGSHATLWAGTANSAVDIHPTGWTSSAISDIHTGVQVGYVSGGPGTHAAAWIGTASSFVDLHAFIPPGFLTSTASGVEVDVDGIITIVGSGFNTVTQRNEALMWRANAIPECVTNIDCDDGIACTLDSCDVASGFCDFIADDTLCDDGLFCNGIDYCDHLLGCQFWYDPCFGLPCDENTDTCGGCLTDADCDDFVTCTLDVCDVVTGFCGNTPDNVACDNGVYCDGAETCDPTLDCQPGIPVDCGDGVHCTIDACDEATTACHHAPSHAVCDNGLFCDGTETCDPVLDCQPGTPVDCSDSVACTNDSCNEITNACDHVPSNTLCDDGLFCNGAETCNTALGCQVGTPINCDDNVACTVDSCNESTNACDHVPSNTLCDDGVFCNGTEACNAAVGCVAGVDPCPGQQCDEASNVCVTGRQLWMVFKSTTILPGLGAVENEDIVSYSEATNSWSLIFDGSDLGLASLALDGLARRIDGAILLSLETPGSIAGLTGGPNGANVDDSDVVLFVPTSLGDNTTGAFTFYFDASDVALTSNDEDVDAIALDASGNLVLSTFGAFTATGASGQDEDLIVFTPTSLGSVTAGSFSFLFDGSDVALTTNNEDVDAVAFTATGSILFSTLGRHSVTGATGADEDVLEFFPVSLGLTTTGTYATLLDLSTLGIDPAANLTALEVIE